MSFAAGRPLTSWELDEPEVFFPPILPLPVSNLLECIPLEAFDCKDGEGGDGEEYDTMFKVACGFEDVGPAESCEEGCEVRTLDSEVITSVLLPEADEDALLEPSAMELSPPLGRV